MKQQQKKYEKQEEERYFVTSIDSIDGKDVNTLTYQWERHKNLLTCKHGAIFKDNPLKVMYQAKVKWCTSLGLLKFCFLDIKFTRTSSFTHLFLSLSLSLFHAQFIRWVKWCHLYSLWLYDDYDDDDDGGGRDDHDDDVTGIHLFRLKRLIQLTFTYFLCSFFFYKVAPTRATTWSR